MNTCRLKSIVAVGASMTTQQLPALWSQESVRTRLEYTHSEPFPSSKFNKFLELLPNKSSVSAAFGCEARKDGKCESCAVVGASGTLLARDDGARIDAHEVVIRPNWLVIKGYESHVGTRTSLNIIFALENMVDQVRSCS